jgi:hypothetical protein
MSEGGNKEIANGIRPISKEEVGETPSPRYGQTLDPEIPSDGKSVNIEVIVSIIVGIAILILSYSLQYFLTIYERFGIEESLMAQAIISWVLFSLGIPVLLLGLVILIKSRKDTSLGHRTLFLGDFEEERAIGTYLGTFSLNIANRKLYGIFIQKGKKVYRVVLLWGHPDNCMTYVKDNSGRTTRLVLRAKIIQSLMDVIKKGFFEDKSEYKQDEKKKMRDVELKIRLSGLDQTVWVSPYGNQKVEEFFSDNGINSIPMLKLETIIKTKEMTEKLDEFRKQTNKLNLSFYNKIFPLYQNIARTYPAVVDMFSALMGTEARQLELQGILEHVKSVPDQLKDTFELLQTYKEQLGSFGGEADGTKMEMLISMVADMEKRIAKMEFDKRPPVHPAQPQQY